LRTAAFLFEMLFVSVTKSKRVHCFHKQQKRVGHSITGLHINVQTALYQSSRMRMSFTNKQTLTIVPGFLASLFF